MAAINVRILSREFIKPSTPTPHNTQSEIKFSGLDQIYADSQFPTIFFFKNQPYSSQMDSNSSKLSKQLKESLSLALTKFYPLAGRIKEDYSSLICNDDGALYLEAQVDANLTDSSNTHDAHLYSQHLGKSRVPLSVQLTFFKCGGTAIGIHYSHWIADAWTFAMFLNYWAGISFRAGAGGGNIQPVFGLGSDIFPPSFNRGTPSTSTIEENTSKMVLKRFLFKKENIADLKKQASSGNCPIQDPTQVEVVSGFIWKEIIQMHKSKPNHKTELIARFPVNLRNRLQINNSAMGNFVISTPVVSTVDTETDLGYLVEKFRKAANFHKKIDVGFDCVKYCYETFEAAKKPEVWSCMFTSLCGIPIYEVDFGWGKPLLIIPKGTKPMVLLATAKNGIEAWINLCVDEMGMISKKLLSQESQTELLVKAAHSRL